jgi:hypothetical protein
MTAKVETPRPWIRLYTEFATDPIIQALSFEDQRHYILILITSGSLDGISGPGLKDHSIRLMLGISNDRLSALKSRLTSIGLIDENWNQTWRHK